MQKIFFKSLMIIGIMGAASCAPLTEDNAGDEYVSDSQTEVVVADMYTEPQPVFMETPLEAAKIYNKRVPPLNTVIVCRDKQCAPAELSMSREYIFNSLAHLVDNNLDETALLCEANPQAHVCVNPYLTVPAKVGVTPAYVYFDGVKLVDGSSVKGKTALNLALGYNLSYNGQTPTVCKPDKALLYVKSNNDIVLNGSGFKCEMTSVGATTIRIMFNIDYIDMDYGYIGGYYSIGLSGPANGGGSGYGLIRLVKDVKPLKPVLTQQKVENNAPQNYCNGVLMAPCPSEAWSNNADGVQVRPYTSASGQNGVQMSAPYAAQNGQQSAYMKPAPNELPLSAGQNAQNVEPQIVYERAQNGPQNYADGNIQAEKPLYQEVQVDDLDDYIK